MLRFINMDGFDVVQKQVLRRGLVPDPFTCSLYACAPYQGCGHGCLYCDGRAEKYYFEGEFDRDIRVRVASPLTLAAQLDKEREASTDGRRPMVSLGSGVTDVYQPLEEERTLTAGMAEVLAQRDFPVFLITKSALVRRDLELWKAVGQRGGFILAMTITTLDDHWARIFEPGASAPQERVATLGAFKAAGLGTGMFAMPLCPGMTDREDQVRDLYQTAGDLGVDFFQPGGLTLRPGRQKDIFLSAVKKHFPHLLEGYAVAYEEQRPSGMPTVRISQKLYSMLGSIGGPFGIPYLIPHKLLSRMLPRYESTILLLAHMEELYKSRGHDVGRLRAAGSVLRAWLSEQRGQFRRQRSLPRDWIDREWRKLFEGNKLIDILHNVKLGKFCRDVQDDGVYFDYVDLRIKAHGEPLTLRRQPKFPQGLFDPPIEGGS